MIYRANIDGLRAIAVLSVILYHAGFSLFSGGFVGVDVFFVISGYLISSIIIADLESKHFSFSGFYARRAGRILPALFFVLLISLIPAYFFLIPNQLKDFSKSLIYVSTFVSNIYFMKHVDYFDIAVDLKPLVHTWSLSIEEQYYMIFPLLMWATIRLKTSWRFMMILMLAALSFIALHIYSNNPTQAFFLFQTRCWELLVGVLIAIYKKAENDHLAHPVKPRNYFSYLGLSVVLLSVFMLSNRYPYPSSYTLIPVMGTALILFSVSQKNIVNDFLSFRPLVAVGLISYSAYLWHQPILAFARVILMSEPLIWLKLLLVCITFLLAFLTWRYVENPCRKLSHTNKKLTLQLSFIGCLLLILIGSVGEKNNGFPKRYSLPITVLKQLHNPDYIACDGICQIGDLADIEPTIALFGDSHAASMAYLFDSLGKKAGAGVVYSGRLSCPPLLGVYADEPSDKAMACIKRNNDNFEYVKNHPNLKKVFFVSRWTYYTDGDYSGRNIKKLKLIPIGSSGDRSHDSFEMALKRTLVEYKRLGVEIYFVSQAPLQKVDGDELYYQIGTKKMNEREVKRFIDKWSVSLLEHQRLQSYVNSVFIDASRDQGVVFVNMDSALCGAEVCPIGIPGQPFYADNNHLTEKGALSTSKLFLGLVKK